MPNFLRAHPEFGGKVDATVIADGQVLLSAKRAKRRSTEDEHDPVMLGFLSFLQTKVQKMDKVRQWSTNAQHPGESAVLAKWPEMRDTEQGRVREVRAARSGEIQ